MCKRSSKAATVANLTKRDPGVCGKCFEPNGFYVAGGKASPVCLKCVRFSGYDELPLDPDDPARCMARFRLLLESADDLAHEMLDGDMLTEPLGPYSRLMVRAAKAMLETLTDEYWSDIGRHLIDGDDEVETNEELIEAIIVNANPA